MSVTTHKGDLPHIEWIDLKNNGVLVECAVMKKDARGNIYFIQTNVLDNTDRRRLGRILANRNAKNFPLWDLMSNITLNNGVNALEYFHQLVRIITPQGVVMSPRSGEVGTGVVSAASAPASAQAPKAAAAKKKTSKVTDEAETEESAE